MTSFSCVTNPARRRSVWRSEGSRRHPHFGARRHSLTRTMNRRWLALLVPAAAIAALGPLTAVPAASGGKASGRPKCDGLGATIVGTGGHDRIVGTSGVDVIVAGGGDDAIYGRRGVDAICGGRGDDHISGGAANDGGQPAHGDVPPGPGLFGGRGRDTISGGKGRDLIEGGPGGDVLAGNRRLDLCKGQKPTPDRLPRGDIAARSCEGISGAIRASG
jgi:hypothetical protein